MEWSLNKIKEKGDYQNLNTTKQNKQEKTKKSTVGRRQGSWYSTELVRYIYYKIAEDTTRGRGRVLNFKHRLPVKSHVYRAVGV